MCSVNDWSFWKNNETIQQLVEAERNVGVTLIKIIQSFTDLINYFGFSSYHLKTKVKIQIYVACVYSQYAVIYNNSTWRENFRTQKGNDITMNEMDFVWWTTQDTGPRIAVAELTSGI